MQESFGTRTCRSDPPGVSGSGVVGGARPVPTAATYSAPVPFDVPPIAGAEMTPEALEVRFEGRSEPVCCPWRWVRDHGEDSSSLDPVSGQRLVDTFAIPADVRAESVVVAAGAVTVEWPAGTPPTVLSAELLAGVAGLARPPRRETWGAGSFPDPLPTVDHDEVVGTDGGVLAWLAAVERWGFGLVRGMPTERGAAVALANRIARPRSTIFGEVWRLAAGLTEHADSAYSRTSLEPHTDATYSHDAPGLQLFACIERDGAGGESILVDGFAAAEQLRADAPERFDMLTRVAVPGRYVEPGVSLLAERPTIGLDAAGAVRQITFNNYDRAPFLLPAGAMERWYEAYGHFHRLVAERRHWLLIRLEPGDALLFDNWRVLHGRTAFAGRRVFDGCYHHREDFESRLRVLRASVDRGAA